MGSGKGKNKRVRASFLSHPEVPEKNFDVNVGRKSPRQRLAAILGDSGHHIIYKLPSGVRIERLKFGSYRVYDVDGYLVKSINGETGNQETAELAMKLHYNPFPK